MKSKLIILMLLIGFLSECAIAQTTDQMFPKKMRDFLGQERLSTKSANLLDTDITVVKIKPWLYKLQYESQEWDSDYYQLTYCMADFIASTNGFNYWDIGELAAEAAPLNRSRYVRYVVMRMTNKDDWIGEVKQEGIRLENDFDQVERQVALARLYCPNQVRSMYLRQDMSSKHGDVYFVEGVKFSNKVRDYFKENTTRELDPNFLAGTVLIQSDRNLLFRIKLQFEKPLDGIYALHLGVLAACVGQKLKAGKSSAFFKVGIPKEAFSKTQSEFFVLLGENALNGEMQEKEIQWSSEFSNGVGGIAAALSHCQ